MGVIIKDGITYSDNMGMVASKIPYRKSDGTNSDVQTEIENVNTNLDTKYGVDETRNIETTGDVIANKGMDNEVKLSNTICSHIGMVIHSTTLDTMQKVIDIYGGLTWEKIEGRFLLGASDDYGIATTGGEATHTLTVNEMPSHSHNVLNYTKDSNYGSTKNYPVSTYSAMYIEASYKKNSAATTLYDGGVPGGITSNVGGSQPHNNMPPYKVVYIWERVE